MIRRPPRSTLSSSSAASDVYKRQAFISDLNYHSRSRLAMSTTEFWAAVESARACGACVAYREMRVCVAFSGDMYTQDRHRFSGKWANSSDAHVTPIRTQYRCAAVGRLLYVTGGCGGSGNLLDSVEVLDTANGTWGSAAPLPTARRSHDCTVVDTLLYVSGGRQADLGGADRVDVLDTETNTWSTLTPSGSIPAYAWPQDTMVFCPYTEQPCARYCLLQPRAREQ
eukprot:TRINITY_DN10369_c0_g1_i3.p2 TRINITY_DN10369_c0_g1~~TRINITY_DN10369_c0_g1_i3.p2  ORF type:complete len:226 (+),score=26.06 TRINITY_DN10369_c0_g1_i3:105-782(+)